MAKSRVRGQPRTRSPYQQRIDRYLRAHPGATRQQARGHHRAEHVERKEREIRAGQLTSSQRQSLKRYAERSAERISGGDPDDLFDQLRAMVQAEGYGAFELLKQTRQELRQAQRERTARPRAQRRKRLPRDAVVIQIDTRGRSANRAKMEALAARFNIDWRLLFYHR